MAGRLFVLGSPTEGNVELASGLARLGIPVELLAPRDAPGRLETRDVALGRLDVLRSLDGVEPGLDVLPVLERHGIRVLNGRDALLAAHDKLRTALLLEVAGIAHPRTVSLPTDGRAPPLELPFVVKPRFGSWGQDVLLCRDRAELERLRAAVRARPWFRRGLAIAQELIPPVGFDLRLVVAGGVIVGAGERVAAPGDWRTNISLGGSLRPARLGAEACDLGRAAARAAGADLVGVDLMPHRGGWTVIELNGAVDFDQRYALPGQDVYRDVAVALGLVRAPTAFRGRRIGESPDADCGPPEDAGFVNLLVGGV